MYDSTHPVQQIFRDLPSVHLSSAPDLLHGFLLPALGDEPASRLWKNPNGHTGFI